MGSSRTRLVLAIAVVAVVVVGVVAWQRHQRNDEWQHGGDAVAARATFEDAKPWVLKATWTGSPDTDGTYQFILLDDRVTPARPIHAEGVQTASGGEGSNWAGAYNVLPDHYPWLAGVAPERSENGWTDSAEALSADAAKTGTATLRFRPAPDDLSTERPEDDLILAMVFVDADGEVRWARQVPLG